MVTRQLFSVRLLHDLMRYQWLDNLTLINSVLTVIALFSPFFLLNHYAERPWVGALTLPYLCITALIGAISVFQLVWTLFFPSAFSMGYIDTVLNGCNFIAYVLLIVACFCVRVSPVAPLFRLLGVTLTVSFFVQIGWQALMTDYYTGYLPFIKSVVRYLIFSVGIVPLAMLNYRAWKRDERSDWQADVDTLGMPEEGV
jgi:hypothetical protein